MANFVFVTWNGGGNLTPAPGIAHALVERHHRVTFLGEEAQRDRTRRQAIHSPPIDAVLNGTAHRPRRPPSGSIC